MPRSSNRRTRRTATAMVAAGATLVSTALALLPGTAGASSHREAPLIAETPAYDNTDLYAFLSPTEKDTVVFVSNWFGLQEPNGGPTFYPWADERRDTGEVLALMRYYTAHGAKPYCDGAPPTETDRAWARLYVGLDGAARNVSTVLG